MAARTRAFGYVRVSSRGQLGGDGPDRQERAIRSYAKRHRLTIADVFADAHTGTEADRPAFHRMLEAILGDGVRVIVVEGLDRLARTVAVQDQLITYLAAKQIMLISAATGEDVTAAYAADPTRVALIQMQAVFAQLEKSRLVQKLRHARERVRKEQGRCEGVRPFGALPGELEVVQRIVSLRRTRPGGRPMSYARIADQLNQERAPTRRGGPWRASSVQSVLTARSG